MPLKLRVMLEGEPPRRPFQHAKGLRALALHWIAEADPALAEEIHDANAPKPYTISPLWTEERRSSRSWFEIGLLLDELTTRMLHGLEQSERNVRLGEQSFIVRDLCIIQQESWEELLTLPDRMLHELAFRLTTPTAHHAASLYRKSIVTPSPEHYFANWLARWNLYSPFNLDPVLLSWVEQQVAVKEFEGGTRLVKLDAGRSFIGFQGVVTFAILKPETLPVEVATALTALARFAEYSGTGVDTMRGMGQTMLIGPGTSQR
jgi:CRISPR-associated endoribonuclease Cas6